MRVARYQGEKNLTGLAKRLYRVDAAGHPPDEAAPALEEANRHLELSGRGLAKRVPPGTMIAVPELEGAYDRRSSQPRITIAASVLRARALDVLSRAAVDGEARDERESVDIDALEKTVRSDEFAELVRSNDRLREKARAIQTSIDERRERLDFVRERRAQALRDARERIEQLAKAAGLPR